MTERYRLHGNVLLLDMVFPDTQCTYIIEHNGTEAVNYWLLITYTFKGERHNNEQRTDIYPFP